MPTVASCSTRTTASRSPIARATGWASTSPGMTGPPADASTSRTARGCGRRSSARIEVRTRRREGNHDSARSSREQTTRRSEPLVESPRTRSRRRQAKASSTDITRSLAHESAIDSGRSADPGLPVRSARRRSAAVSIRLPARGVPARWNVVFDRIGDRGVAIVQGAPKTDGLPGPAPDATSSTISAGSRRRTPT